jgi:hypothetical protein
MLLAIRCRQFGRIVAYLQAKIRWIAGLLRRPVTAPIHLREEFCSIRGFVSNIIAYEYIFLAGWIFLVNLCLMKRFYTDLLAVSLLIVTFLSAAF